MFSQRIFYLLPLVGLSLSLLAVTREAEPDAEASILAIQAVTQSEPIGEAELLGLRKGLTAFRESQPGLSRNTLFVDQVANEDLVIVSQWSSLEAAEDGSLAFDGSETEKAMNALGQLQSTRFFRQLRLEEYSRGDHGYTEVVVFRTQPGTTRAEHLNRFDAAEEGFQEEEGVVGHSLGLSLDGHWLHLVHWKSAADFGRSSKALMRNSGVRSWITSLDFTRFQQQHGTPL